jgi:hypothetical protein
LARRKNHAWSCTPGSGYTFYLLGGPPRGREDSDAKSSHLRKAMTKDMDTSTPAARTLNVA